MPVFIIVLVLIIVIVSRTPRLPLVVGSFLSRHGSDNLLSRMTKKSQHLPDTGLALSN
jgi:hypothetical protein